MIQTYSRWDIPTNKPTTGCEMVVNLAALWPAETFYDFSPIKRQLSKLGTSQRLTIGWYETQPGVVQRCVPENVEARAISIQNSNVKCDFPVASEKYYDSLVSVFGAMLDEFGNAINYELRLGSFGEWNWSPHTNSMPPECIPSKELKQDFLAKVLRVLKGAKVVMGTDDSESFAFALKLNPALIGLRASLGNPRFDDFRGLWPKTMMVEPYGPQSFDPHLAIKQITILRSKNIDVNAGLWNLTHEQMDQYWSLLRPMMSSALLGN